MKICAYCRQLKLPSAFSKSSRAKSGLQTYCKACQAEKNFNDRSMNREKRLGIERRSREKHWEKNTWNWIFQRTKGKKIPLCSKEHFSKWMKEQVRICYYCLMTDEVAKIAFKKRLSVDRKTPYEGYVPNNMVLACHRCNLVKNKYLTFFQMEEIAKKYFRPALAEAKGE